MKIDFIPENIVSFVKEHAPRLITEQQKKIILVVSVALGLCCMLYWIRSRSLSGRVKKIARDSDLEKSFSPEKPENRGDFDQKPVLVDGLEGINQEQEEESPVSTASQRSFDQLEDRSLEPNADLESKSGGFLGETESENHETELKADLHTFLSEDIVGESSAIEQLEDEIHQDVYRCIDYLVEEFSVKADDAYYTSDGKRKKTFVHELDFLKEGYQLRKSAIEKPKEEGVLLYFEGTLPESIRIVEDQENESATLNFQISWGEEEALPSTILWARELKSVLESRDTLYTEVKEQLEEEEKEQEKKKSQLTLLRKSAIEEFFSQKFLHPDR